MDEEVKIEEPKPRRKPTKAVKVVSRNGLTLLVEWTIGDDLRRGYVPGEKVKDGRIEAEELGAACPYGVAWEEKLELDSMAPDSLAKLWRSRGIWTIQDLQKRWSTAKLMAGAQNTDNIAKMLRKELANGNA